ncbi:CoA-binding protein [Pedobacter sp.]|uniref:CoA-binding protein n=1 Tax=Pedobacter sp. TaxID=1411316 RepID=UPI00396C387F
MKKTLIIGASTNPERYAYKAAHMLTAKGHSIINIGVKEGEVAGVKIEKPSEPYHDVDTITLYIGVPTQPQYYNYILETKPKRVVFNPGTENAEFEDMLEQNGIEAIEACTLVLLTTGQY